VRIFDQNFVFLKRDVGNPALGFVKFLQQRYLMAQCCFELVEMPMISPSRKFYTKTCDQYVVFFERQIRRRCTSDAAAAGNVMIVTRSHVNIIRVSNVVYKLITKASALTTVMHH